MNTLTKKPFHFCFHFLSSEDEKCVTAGTDDGKKKQDSVSRKKKTPAKPGKKFPSGHNSDQTGENMNSDSGVSVTESNSKSSLVNRVSFRHKRFSKTAELVDQATKAVEFDDSLVTEDNERQHENNVKAKLNVSKTEKNLLRKNTVKKVKLVSPAKLESQVSIGKNKGKDGFDIKSSVLQQNDENMKSGRLSSEESQSDDEDADAEGSTCTEEDEQEPHLKNDRKTERKQRTKLVKKVKVRRLMMPCFSRVDLLPETGKAKLSVLVPETGLTRFFVSSRYAIQSIFPSFFALFLLFLDNMVRRYV